MKRTKYQKSVADQFIKILRGFKAGKQIQRFSRDNPRWHDIDLWYLMNPKTAVKYRIKK